MKNTICVAQSWDKIHKYLFKPTYKRTFGGRKKNGYSLYNKMFRYVKIPKPSYSKETYD